MGTKEENSVPKRQRRLSQVFETAPSYFVTLCTADRQRVLDNADVFERIRSFTADSMDRYGVYVDSYVLMPDHIHLIITVSATSDIALGAWVKAFKAMVSLRQFKWQSGFFDHILRNDESRSEKWEYIRNNPVRAGFVDDPNDWPYAERFSRYDGSIL